MDRWYPWIKNETFKTIFVDVTVEELIALREYCRSSFPSRKAAPSFSEEHRAIVDTLASKVSKAIDKVGKGNGAFVKLNTRRFAPKPGKNVLSCLTGGLSRFVPTAPARIAPKMFTSSSEMKR
jgi:hypothetical protein